MNNANTNDPLNRRAEAGGPTHDAWNRLVKVSVGGTAILEQQFNGLGWRTLKRSNTNASGSVDEERVTYDSYGQARHHFGADIDGNGAVDGADLGVVTGLWGKTVSDATYRSEADLNRDGTIDGGDMGIVLNYRSALPTGQLSDTAAGGPDNVIGWDGYIFNAATADYLVRRRTYLPPLGRWGERDPIGYISARSLYGYCCSRPSWCVDPSGLVPDGIFDPTGPPTFFPGSGTLRQLADPQTPWRDPLLHTEPPAMRPWNESDDCPPGTDPLWVCRGRLGGDSDGIVYDPGVWSHSYISCVNPFTSADPTQQFGKQPRSFESPGELICVWYQDELLFCYYSKSPFSGPGYIVTERDRDVRKATCKKRCVDPACKSRLCREGPAPTPYEFTSSNCHEWASQCDDLSGR